MFLEEVFRLTFFILHGELVFIFFVSILTNQLFDRHNAIGESMRERK